MKRGFLVGFALLFIFAVLPLTGSGQPAPPPEKRVALVVGIAAYRNAPALANPVNDARAISESLRRLGFEVDEVFDPDFRALTRGLREFGIKAQKADAAVIYYAGHGVQVGRENYMLPADAKLERERDLLYEAVPLELFLGEASQAKKLGIVLLDSCRNNPFIDRLSRSMTIAGRGTTNPGLARVDNVPRNTMVVMATKADQIAEDGGGGNSPFAEALLAHFQVPGLELSLFFRSVRDTVLKATNNRQEPFIFSSLGAEPFYFYPRPPNRPPQIGAIRPLEVRDNTGPTALPIPAPTDPDQDPLTVRITGLPRYGEVRVEGRTVTPGAVFAADRFATATYKPDGAAFGAVGTLDILVEDGRGGSALGSLAIAVLPSNRQPVAEARRRLRVYTGPLGIAPPEDPDGDPLSITVRALPRGLVRNAAATLRNGDKLRPEQLAALTYVPEPGFTGAAGNLQYVVEDGRGGRAEGTLDIEVMDAAEAAVQMLENAVWERLQASGKVEDVETFLSLYPNSHLASTAQRRRDELLGRRMAAASPSPTPQPMAAPPAPPPAAAAPRPAEQRPGPPDRLAALQPIAPPAPPPPRDPGPAEPPRAMMLQPSPVAPPPAAREDRYFQDCPTCPWMVRVPGGSFTMGFGARDSSALPARRVSVRSFALGQYPVTVAEWKACHAAGGCAAPPRMAVAEDSTPIHNVNWEDAQQYVAWLSRAAGHAYRLPSEAEWEYAARAGTSTRYWWGDQVGTALANCADCGGAQDPRGPMPVDHFQPNGFGLYGMLGGVAQWTQDCWAPNYQGAPTDGSARETRGCMKRVLRGGSFRAGREEITPVSRGNYDAPVRYLTNGFRVARNAD